LYPHLVRVFGHRNIAQLLICTLMLRKDAVFDGA